MRPVLLTLCLLAAPFAHAQQAQLRIVIVEGEDVLNNTVTGVNRNVVVEVRGPDQMPVSGATVTFVLPDAGASGTFPNGQKSLMVDTNNQGRATAAGIRSNNIAGPMQIRVSAAYLGIVATAVIRQTNVAVAVTEGPKPQPAKETAAARPTPAATTAPPAKQGMSTGKKIGIILAIVGGAAAGGIVVGGKGGSNSSGGGGPTTPPPIVITPGAPVVGGI